MLAVIGFGLMIVLMYILIKEKIHLCYSIVTQIYKKSTKKALTYEKTYTII